MIGRRLLHDEILGKLGEGGMGEARPLASMNRRNTASIYRREESAGIRAIVIELVEGETLARRISRGALPIRQAPECAAPIPEALGGAHKKGPQPTGALSSGLSTGRSPSPPPDMTTASTEQVPPVGLSPTGTPASIAAPNPSTYDSFIHYTMPALTGALGANYERP